MINKAFRQELTTAIPELAGQIYPTNAPATAKRPYLVYVRLNTDMLKSLEGCTGNEGLRYMFSIMAPRYEDMAELREKVKNVILSFPGRAIGEGPYIQEINIHNIDEAYEFNLTMNRGIIDFTIYI